MKRTHGTPANIRAELARAGKTQSHVAERLQITRQGVSRRLLGQTPFTVDELYAIADLLNVPASTLLDPTQPDPVNQ